MKKFSIILFAGLMVLASGCGSSYAEYEKSVLNISKNGSVTETIYDVFDESYYIAEELEDSIKEEITAYNAAAEDELVELKDCDVDEQSVEVKMVYESAEDYAAFNHVALFSGSIEDFVGSEYHGYVDLMDSDGNTIPLSLVVATGDDYNVIVTDMDCILELKGKVAFVSEDVDLLSDKVVNVTMSDMAYAYIIYK